MGDAQEPVVIVGAGQAGGWVALTIRQHQPDRPIVLIGAEAHPPYERPPLSKDILAGKADPESAYLKPLAHYADNGIDLRLQTRVTAIDPPARAITLSNGETLSYGTLVLATGMRPRLLPVPGGDHPRLRTLRALSDVEAIRQALVPGQRIVAIGAGFIGLEVAAVAREAGCAVEILEAGQHALGRVVAPEIAHAIVARHKVRGVAFRFGVAIEDILDRDGAPALRLADGALVTADLIVCGIGGLPNDEIARAAGLACDNGICVDEHGRTSDENIYAVGDVSRQFNLALERAVRLESWQNAQNQAIAVGREIAGVPEPYSDLPWFWSDQGADNFQLIGLPERWDRIVWRGAPGDDKFTAIYLLGDRIVAANALNNARDIRPLRQMIVERTVVDDQVLADTSLALVKISRMQPAQ